MRSAHQRALLRGTLPDASTIDRQYGEPHLIILVHCLGNHIIERPAAIWVFQFLLHSFHVGLVGEFKDYCTIYNFPFFAYVEQSTQLELDAYVSKRLGYVPPLEIQSGSRLRGHITGDGKGWLGHGSRLLRSAGSRPAWLRRVWRRLPGGGGGTLWRCAWPGSGRTLCLLLSYLLCHLGHLDHGRWCWVAGGLHHSQL